MYSAMPAKNVYIKLRLEDSKLDSGSFRAGPRRQGGATKYSPILNSEEEITVPNVPVVQIVQSPSFILPRVAGEERGGVNWNAAVERFGTL